MKNLDIIVGDAALLDRVHRLWMELNKHHSSVSTYFSKNFDQFTFEDRKATLNKLAITGHLLIEMVVDRTLNEDVGYCISAVSADKKGEIESIFIKPEFRNLGLGDTLMARAIKWLDKMEVSEKIVAVAYGNEQVFGFYAKYGFLPRITVLREKSE